MEFLKEFWEFTKVRKKYWLMPIVIILLFFGIFVIVTEGSSLAPLIYAMW
jgi:hypothetical protein|tara:strand:- start:372 stop:521 length:150 start_codon:yes stop_codon:yes gene_type:complete